MQKVEVKYECCYSSFSLQLGKQYQNQNQGASLCKNYVLEFVLTHIFFRYDWRGNGYILHFIKLYLGTLEKKDVSRYVKETTTSRGMVKGYYRIAYSIIISCLNQLSSFSWHLWSVLNVIPLFPKYLSNTIICLLSTAKCNNRLVCSAGLVYSSQYNDQKVRHVVYSAQYVILKRK